MPSVATLLVPEIDHNVDNHTAAQAYAAAGWHVYPVYDPELHGHALDPDWQETATRDPQQIATLWTDLDIGIGLHLGHSGAVAVTIPTVPDKFSPELPASATLAGLHDGQPESTRIYAAPADLHIPNLAADGGELRGTHAGITVRQPLHQWRVDDSETTRWLSTGPLAPLPAMITGTGTPTEVPMKYQADQAPDFYRGSSGEWMRSAVPPTAPTAATTPGTGSRWRVRTLANVRTVIPEWAWEYDGRGRILKGGLTLFAGRPAAGKSTTARWFAAGWTQGTLPGCWEGKPVNVLYVASEESWQHTVGPSLIAAGANPDRIVHLAAADDGPARINVCTDKADILAVCAENGIRAVILDPLMSTLGAGPDLYRSNEVREALTPWAEISEAIDGVVLGITHLTKAARDVTAGINGSSAFGEVARCVFGFAVDQEADDGTRVMTQSKNSSGVEGLNLAYRLTETPVTVSDGGATEMVRFTLLGNTDRTVRDLLAAEQAGGRDTGSECVQWLKGYLNVKGPTPALEVRADGAELGFSESAIKRAMRKLKVHSERLREAGGPSVWSLPTAAGQ
ncbi:AAA family ATPase [Mycobacterium sp. SVM_VP21]|nr:AAA family ATPase [Mycobacterium sp. SVM_VP21]